MRGEDRRTHAEIHGHRRDTGARTKKGGRIVTNTHDDWSADRQTVYEENERGITTKIDGVTFNPKTGKFNKK